jgi:phospholipid-binding lipoprotein MlaA
MDHKSLLLISSICIGVSPSLYASEFSESTHTSSNIEDKSSQSSLKDLKNVGFKSFAVNANAAQPDEVKDPLEPLNRKIYNLNDTLDRNIVRPIAVQYKEKVPEDVRDSYSSFRSNLTEPWSAVNQLVQGRPGRALKTLGRFTINTITTLGFADPAKRIGLSSESDGVGTTLGYYGVPSGPYLVLPIFGPSTLRDGTGQVVDLIGRPQEYLDGNDGLYWSDQAGRGISARASLLDFEGALQGDKYASLRDIYLQRQNYIIAEKKGLDAAAIQFIDDDIDDPADEAIDEIQQDVEQLDSNIK